MKKILVLVVCLTCFSIFAQPIVSSFSPQKGVAGTSVTLSGSGFNSTASNNVVRIGGIKCDITSASSTSLTVTLPDYITSDYFYVTDVANSKMCKSFTKFLAQTDSTPLSFSTAIFASKISISAGATGGNCNQAFGFLDIDDDGDMDFALFENTNKSLKYITNNYSTGTLSSSSFSSTTLKSAAYSNTNCNGTLLIDVDSDGDLDFYCARSGSSGNYSIVYKNTSTSSISINSTGTDITGMGFYGGNPRLGDFNNDGHMDHISAYTWYAHTSENKGTSTPAFSYWGVANTTYGSTTNAATVDINSDGKFDIICTGDDAAYGFKWAINNTTANATSNNYSFSSISYRATTQNYSNLFEGDFNNDGKMDVFVYRNNSASVFRNTSTSTTSYGFSTKTDLSLGSLSVYAVQTADLNNDGYLDLILGTNGIGGNAIYFYRNTTSSTGGNLSFASGVKIIEAVGGTIHHIEVVDINNDGYWDIISKGNSSTNIEIYLNKINNPSNYYIKSSGVSNITSLTNWTSNNDGTGSNPSSFSNLDIFNLSNSSGSTSFSTGNNNWTITNATLVIPSGATMTIGTGRTLTLSGSTLLNSGTISAADASIVISGTGNNTINGTVNIGALTTNTTSNITIGSSAEFNVYTALNLTSIGTFTTNNNVTLKSNSTGTARMGAVSGTISGNMNCEIYVAGGYRKFRFLAHPFSTNQNLSLLTDDIDITGSGGSANGFTTTPTNNPSAFWYNPTNGDGANYDAGWTEFTSAAGGTGNNWIPGQGIIVMLRGDKGEGLDGNTYTPSDVTIDMSGPINTGNVTVNLDYSGSGNSKGLNLLGNPYPCPIDVSGLVHSSSHSSKINKTVYTRNSRQGSYRTDAISSGSAYSVPAYASFFLKTNATTASVTFTESMKQNSSSLSTFLGGGDENTPNLLRISALIKNEVYDKLDFFFGEQYGDTFDHIYDAFKLNNDYFNLYSLTTDGSKVAIDYRKLDTNQLIPIGLGISKNKSDSIELFFDANNTGASLYLFDLLTREKTEIKTGNNYNLYVSDADKETIGNNRLVVGSYSAIQSLSSKLKNDLVITLYPNPVNDILFVHSLNFKGESTIKIADLTGKLVEETIVDFSKEITQSLRTDHLPSGTYFIEITAENGLFYKNKIIK